MQVTADVDEAGRLGPRYGFMTLLSAGIAMLGGKTFPPVQETVDAILASRMRIQDVDPDHPMLFNIQDNVAIAGQGRVYDDRETERLGRSDVAIILLRKLYEREIRAMEDGRPLKAWRRPPQKLPLGFHPADAA